MDAWRSPSGVFRDHAEDQPRSSFGVGLRPTGHRIREISLQYMRKPARCQRITVSGVTMMTARYHREGHVPEARLTLNSAFMLVERAKRELKK